MVCWHIAGSKRLPDYCPAGGADSNRRVRKRPCSQSPTHCGLNEALPRTAAKLRNCCHESAYNKFQRLSLLLWGWHAAPTYNKFQFCGSVRVLPFAVVLSFVYEMCACPCCPHMCDQRHTLWFVGEICTCFVGVFAVVPFPIELCSEGRFGKYNARNGVEKMIIGEDPVEQSANRSTKIFISSTCQNRSTDHSRKPRPSRTICSHVSCTGKSVPAEQQHAGGRSTCVPCPFTQAPRPCLPRSRPARRLRCRRPARRPRPTGAPR